MGQACCNESDENTGSIVAQVSTRTPPPMETPPPVKKEPEPAPVVEKPAEVEPAPPPTKYVSFQPPEVVEAPTPQRKQLVLAFKADAGSSEEMVFAFTHRPLGMDFHRSLPITVKKVHPGSLAESAGVGAGYVLTKVDQDDVTAKTLEAMHDLLKKSAGELPQR